MRWALPICLWLSAAHAVAETPNPEFSETIRYYDVSALTAGDLRRELRREGPNGYWGYAQWWVNWSADCQVTATLTIDMPRHAALDQMAPAMRQAWQDMVKALLAHERVHLQHGINAAEEVVAADCHNPRKIIRKWAAEDRKFDRQTDHGRADGVVLPKR